MQVTLVALLGLLAWLLARRNGPALRAAVLLATLVGLLALPGLPPWRRPGCRCRNAFARPARAGRPALPDRGRRLPPREETWSPSLPGAAAPGQRHANPDGTRSRPEDGRALVKAEAVFLNVDLPGRGRASRHVPPSPPRPDLVPGGMLGGRVACSVRSSAWPFPRPTARCCTAAPGRHVRSAKGAGPTAWRLWPAHAACGGRPAGEPRLASPLTLGLFRPVILLPLDRGTWSAEAARPDPGARTGPRPAPRFPRRAAGRAGDVSVLVPSAGALAGRPAAAGAGIRRRRLGGAAASDSTTTSGVWRGWPWSRIGDAVPWLPPCGGAAPRSFGGLTCCDATPRGFPATEQTGHRGWWRCSRRRSAWPSPALGPCHSARVGHPATDAARGLGASAKEDSHGDPLPAGALARWARRACGTGPT